MGAVNPRHPSGGAACGKLFGFTAAFASASSMSRHSAAIRFRLTAIAVNFAWKLTLRLPQPRARSIPAITGTVLRLAREALILP